MSVMIRSQSFSPAAASADSAVDPRHAARRDGRRVMHVAMVGVQVVRARRIDRVGRELLDHARDLGDSRAALADTRVREVYVEQPHAHQLRRARGLSRTIGRHALAAGQHQHRDGVVLGDMAQQGAAGADLDVVGMGADRQHRRARSGLAARAQRYQLVDLLDQRATVHRLGQEVVRAYPDRLDRVVETAMAGQDQRRRQCLR